MVAQAGIRDMNHLHRDVCAMPGPVEDVDSGADLRGEVDDTGAILELIFCLIEI
jgi:hypothetical protein